MKSKQGIVKVFSERVLLNDESVSEIGNLSTLTNEFDELSVEAHEGVSPTKVIKVMDAIRVTWRGPIHFEAFASPK